ncbi:MAG: LysR substrate-binding domain-containing protein [Rhodopila sp.]
MDLIGSGTDLAVGIGALADSTLVAKRLAPQRRLLVAAPSYLAGRRPAAEPSDLEDHDCLQFALQPKQAWYFLPHDAATTEPLEVAVRGRLRANDSEALLDAALAGLGIALLPSWLTGEAIEAGQLTPLLPEREALIAPGPRQSIWAVYPPPKKVV